MAFHSCKINPDFLPSFEKAGHELASIDPTFRCRFLPIPHTTLLTPCSPSGLRSSALQCLSVHLLGLESPLSIGISSYLYFIDCVMHVFTYFLAFFVTSRRQVPGAPRSHLSFHWTSRAGPNAFLKRNKC